MFKLPHKQIKLSHCFCQLAGWILIPHNSAEIALQDTNHGNTTKKHPNSVHSAV